MKRKRLIMVLSIAFVLASCVDGYSLYSRGRPAPVPVREKLYDGVVYQRVVQVLL